jgi:hypothetical protein
VDGGAQKFELFEGYGDESGVVAAGNCTDAGDQVVMPIFFKLFVPIRSFIAAAGNRFEEAEAF